MILKNKIILITGAASGIGKSIAAECLKEGAKVLIVDINEVEAQKTLEELLPFGEVKFIYADLTKEKDIENSIKFCIEYFKKLDIIINNARPILKEFNFEKSFSEWDLGMNILLKAPALYAKYASPYLKKSSNGLILNISSTNAKFISHQPLIYHIAKAGLEHLTKYLANNLGPEGVRVNSIAPGLVSIKNKDNKTDKEKLYNSIAKQVVPLGRFASISEVSRSIVALCSDYFTFLNGENIVLDGGSSTFDHFHAGYKTLESISIKELYEKN